MNTTISTIDIEKEVMPVIKEVFKRCLVEHSLISDLNGYMFNICSGVGMMDVIAITTERRLTISRLLIKTFITKEGEDNGIIHSQFYHGLYEGVNELSKILNNIYGKRP